MKYLSFKNLLKFDGVVLFILKFGGMKWKFCLVHLPSEWLSVKRYRTVSFCLRVVKFRQMFAHHIITDIFMELL